MKNNFELQLEALQERWGEDHPIISQVQEMITGGYFSTGLEDFKRDFQRANGNAKKLSELVKKAWKATYGDTSDFSPITTKEAKSIGKSLADFDLS